MSVSMATIFISCLTYFTVLAQNDGEITLEDSRTLALVISDRLKTNFESQTNFRRLKEEYNGLDYSFKKWDIATLLADLAEDVEGKFHRVRRCLIHLRTRVQQQYQIEFQTEVVRRVNLTEDTSNNHMEYSDQHGQNVSFSKSSYSTPADVSLNGSKVEKDIFWTSNLKESFITNKEQEPELLVWQYFCTENGVLRLFPAIVQYPEAKKGTVDYDCRFQPWYIEGDGCPRDIIIAFDLSGSMIGWPLEMAQNTAAQILKLMSDNDFVGFIGISRDPVYISDSFNNSLKLLNRATEKVKHDINTFIENIEPNVEANFDKAIDAAFDMFDDSRNAARSTMCQKVLVIFSDGTIQSCEDTLRNRNPNKEVQIFSFACGKARTTTSGLREMACDNRGSFFEISELADVNSKVFQFFQQINSNSNSGRENYSLKWSNTYTEEVSLPPASEDNNLMQEFRITDKKMVVSVSVPAYYKNEKIGIAGFDIKIDGILSKITTLNKSGLYVILLNNRGNVIYHPRLEPLPELDKTYTARLAEVEQCRGKVSAADIENTIVSRGSGMVEGDCIYHFSRYLQVLLRYNKRGREFFMRMQFHFNALEGFPFFIVLAVPSAFSYEIETTKNITDILLLLQELLVSGSRQQLEDGVSSSFSGWFGTSEDSNKETERYSKYVLNETAVHYSVANDVVFKSWKFESSVSKTVIPKMIYAPSGLLLFNHEEWLDIPENSHIFVENDRLIASLEAKNLLTMSPLRNSTESGGSYLLTKTIELEIETPATPAVIGFELFYENLRQMIILGRMPQKNQANRVTDMLVDDKGFIIFIEPISSEVDFKGSHLTNAFPELMQVLLKKSIFVIDTFNNCLSTCKYRKLKAVESSAGRCSYWDILSFINGSLHLSRIMLLFQSFVSFVSGHSQLGATISLKDQRKNHFRCCKTYSIFKLSSDNVTDHALEIKCGDCTKRFFVSPIENTNLLLVTEAEPDCICDSNKRSSDHLGIINETDIHNVSFGELSYKTLSCTNNININIVCNNAIFKSAGNFVWALLFAYTFLFK